MKGLSQHFINDLPVTVQATIQYTQRIRNLRLHFVDWQTTFHVTYFLKMRMVKKLIVLRPPLDKMLLIVIF